MLPTRTLPFALAAATALAAGVTTTAVADVINYQWVGTAADGNWNTASNWNPAPASNTIGVSPNYYDAATISGNHTVTRAGTIQFFDSSTPPADKQGEFTALTVINGANFVVTGNDGGGRLRVSTSSYVTRNVLIGAGSSVDVNGYWVGNSGSNNSIGVTTLQGFLNIRTEFIGYQAAANGFTAGWQINVDGGTLNNEGTFKWRFNSVSTNYDSSTGIINITNDGIVNLGDVEATWAKSGNNYVDFVDGSGTLVFNKFGSWSTLTSVETLIANGHIRSSSGGTIQISEGVDAFTLTVVVPEPATYALVASALMLGAVALRRRNRN